MPWLKKTSEHKCKKPRVTWFRLHGYWGCDECLAVWHYTTITDRTGQILAAWVKKDDLIMNPKDKTITQIENKIPPAKDSRK